MARPRHRARGDLPPPAPLGRLALIRPALGISAGDEELTPPAGLLLAVLQSHRSLGEAISLYRASGYRGVPAFSDERYARHRFGKTLP